MISATRLRQNLYRILDSVLESGVPIEIERNGKVLKIVTAKPVSKWDRLQSNDVCSVDPEAIIEIDWSCEWNPDALS